MLFRIGLCFLFFLSGLTSLVYEVVWIRTLSLAVGSTSAAMSFVLALFFLGLSLGSLLSAKRLTATSRPLRTYAILEGLVGLSSFALIYGLIHFPSLLAHLPLQGTYSWIGVIAKFSLVGLLLFVPTVAMGATLPLVVRAFCTSYGTTPLAVSLLYAINTLGAVAGTFLASFNLIPTFGILVTNHLCVATNLLLMGAGLLLQRRAARASNSPVSSDNRSEQLTFGARETGLILLSAVCGFSSLASEVVWNKYLGIFLGNNIYGLGLVLGLYLLGIALGSSILVAFKPVWRRPERFFWILLPTLPIAISATSYLFNWVPTVSTLLATFAPVSLLTARVLVATSLLLPVTILLGALFPLTVHLIAPAGAGADRVVGVAYAANTLGAILGSCLAGLVLMPHFGSATTIRIASFVLAATTLVVWFRASSRSRWAGAVACVSCVVSLSLGNLDFRSILTTAYLQPVQGKSLSQILESMNEEKERFLWVKEGETSVITLSHDPRDGANYRDYLRLKTNGLNESIYHPKEAISRLPRYEALLGLLPYLFSEKPRNAFVVGYGGGYTVDLLSLLPFDKVHVVELEKAIIEAVDFIHGGHNPIPRRKSVDLSVEDARFVLAAKLKAPLDVIVSQPSHSWLAGAANLFTREFFEVVKSNLSDRGVFSQWLNLYNMDAVTLQSILRTFYQVFPYGAVFSGQGDQEMILIGSNRPLRFNSNEAARLAGDEKLVERLADVPFRSASDVLAQFALGRGAILSATEGAPANTDINAYAETRQSRTFYTGIEPVDSPQAFLNKHYRGGFGELLEEGQDWAYPVLASLLLSGQHQKFYAAIGPFEAKYANDPSRQAQLGDLCLRVERYDSARRYLTAAYRRDPSPANLTLLLYGLQEMGKHPEVVKTIAARKAPRDRILDCYWVHSNLELGRLNATRETMSRMANDVPGYTAACGDFFNRLMGNFYFHERQYHVAIPFYEAYKNLYPEDPTVLKRLSVAYLNVDDWPSAAAASGALRAAAHRKKARLDELAKFYEAHDWRDDSRALQALKQGIN